MTANIYIAVSNILLQRTKSTGQAPSGSASRQPAPTSRQSYGTLAILSVLRLLRPLPASSPSPNRGPPRRRLSILTPSVHRPMSFARETALTRIPAATPTRRRPGRWRWDEPSLHCTLPLLRNALSAAPQQRRRVPWKTITAVAEPWRRRSGAAGACGPPAPPPACAAAAADTG